MNRCYMEKIVKVAKITNTFVFSEFNTKTNFQQMLSSFVSSIIIWKIQIE